jgi:GAF domain-containing protein
MNVLKQEFFVPDPKYIDIHSIAAELKHESNKLIEKLRLKRLDELNLIEKQLDDDFDDFALIAATVFDTPYAQLNLIDDTRLWIKSKFGPDNYPVNLPKEDTFCNIAIQNPNEIMIIPDAKKDARVVNNKWVKLGAVRFYAGAPLVTKDGLPLGTLCAIDDKPKNNLTENQKIILGGLARLATSMLTKLR